MVARWTCFAAGFWLVLAPLLLGHPSVGLVIHDVALGTLSCALSLAAIRWPPARLGVLLPASWLLVAPTFLAQVPGTAAVSQRIAGALLLLSALAPTPRPASRPARAGIAA